MGNQTVWSDIWEAAKVAGPFGNMLLLAATIYLGRELKMAWAREIATTQAVTRSILTVNTTLESIEEKLDKNGTKRRRRRKRTR